MSNRAQLTRQKLLQAGREVAFEAGAASLTVEGVARQAGVSKGAVLYHFPSKDGLLGAVLMSLLEGFQEAVAREHERGGSWLKAYLRASFPEQRAGYLRETRTIFAIVTLRPELGSLVRDRFLLWHQRALEDGQDPLTAGLVRAAVDGLWYNEMFGFSLDDEAREALLSRLEQLIDGSAPDGHDT